MPQKLTLEERFWPKVVVPDDPDACWEWTAATHNGYGILNRGERSRTIKASRASWIIHNGPIPDDLWVLHHCDNPPCCNPRHLFLGTHLDNMRDMFSKGRRTAATGATNHGTAKLTAEQVAEARAFYTGRRGECKALCDRFGVHKNTMLAALHGRTWRHLGGARPPRPVRARLTASELAGIRSSTLLHREIAAIYGIDRVTVTRIRNTRVRMDA